MMEARELRIGNLVSTPIVEYFEIRQIDLNDKSIYDGALRPIPLTEEWHNKFGVKRNGFNAFEYKTSDRQLILFSGDYVYLRDLHKKDISHSDDLCVVWNKDLKKRDMFVHEWQNLFMALTGEELTIKL